MSNMTTTHNGFRVEDITFKNARRQCEIDKEVRNNDETPLNNTNVPVSLTPEQVKLFYKSKIAETKDIREKKVYEQTIQWIDDLLDTKKKVNQLEMKQVVNTDVVENDIED